MWKTLCYSVNSSKKEENTLQMHDKMLTSIRQGVNVSVLCSGNSKSKVSNFGSELIVNSASEFVADHFDELHVLDNHDLKLKLFTYLHEVLTLKSQELGVGFVDLATNILLIAVKNDKYILCSLGDSVIAWHKDNKMKIIGISDSNEQNVKYLTAENAFASFKVENSVLKNVTGFTLMSAGTANGFNSNSNNEFDDIVGGIVSTTGSVSDEEMDIFISQVFENFIIHKTDLNCSIIVMSTPKCATRYYSLSIEDKMNLLKFSVHDSNSLGKVKDLDDILAIIGSGKSLSDLAMILNISEECVTNKLQVLVTNNILSLNTAKFYKKIK